MQVDTARAHVYSGSRTYPHRWYFQGCSLLLWLKVGQFSYPRDHSYTSSCPIGTPSLSPLRSCPPVSPSSTFPTVSSLSSHWHLHFSSFCPLKGPRSQVDCGSLRSEVHRGGLGRVCPSQRTLPPWCPRSRFVVWFLFLLRKKCF